MSAITGSWESIPGSELRGRRAIRASTIQQMLTNAVSLYEALANSAAPSSVAAQEYVGHDHGFVGGATITHGAVACIDGFDSPIRTYTPAASPFSDAKLVTRIPVNPGIWLQRNVSLDVWISALAVTEKFSVSVSGGTPVIIEPTAEALGPRWHRLTAPAGDMNHQTTGLVVTVELVGAASTSPSFKLFSVLAAETAALSLPPSVAVQVPAQTGGAEVFSYFDRLDHALADNDEWLDAELLMALESAVSALYEHVSDRPTPGASAQYIRGHDHATDGGRAVPMGLCLSAGGEPGLSLSALYSVVCTTQNQWYFIDESAGTRRSVGTAGGSITAGIWRIPVSPGISSTGSPPTSAPTLYGEAQLTFTGAGSVVEARFYNVTTGTYSETVTLVGGGAVEAWERIPGSGGVWNEIALEVRCTSHAGVSVELFWTAIYEIPYMGSTAISDGGSSGNRILSTPQGRP